MTNVYLMRLFIVFFFVFAGSQIEAKETILMTDQLTSSALNAATQFYEVPLDQNLELNHVKDLSDEHWISGTDKVPNFGYSEHAYWFKLQIQSPRDAKAERYFYRANYPVLDSIQFYLVQGGQLISQQQTGDTLVFDSRALKMNSFVHPIDIKPGQTLTLFIRVQSQGTVQLPATLLSEQDLHSESLFFYICQGIFFGVVGIMLFYNFLLFFAFRAKEYLFYVFYGASVLLLLSTKHGLSFQYLWPESPLWNNKAIPLSMCLCSLFLLAFTYYFLNIQQHSKRLSKVFMSLSFLLICLAALDLSLTYSLAIKFSAIGTGSAIAACVIASIAAWKNHDPNVKQYLIAWLAMLAGAMILLLSMFGILPTNTLTQNAWQIGSGLEIIILSFALANKIRTINHNINIERKRRFEMQAIALKNEKEARSSKEQALEMQLSISENLEKQVKDRTSALQKTMEALEVANLKLHEQAINDGLTGLGNRRHFNDIIEKEWKRCRRNGNSLSLIILDIDHFKLFNDNFGHQVGDECLRHVSHQMLKGCRRPADIATRYGGEEFAIILPDTDLNGAALVAEKIRISIQRKPFLVGNQEMIVTVSLGVACFREALEHANTQDLIKAADVALYQAKGDGRNQVKCA